MKKQAKGKKINYTAYSIWLGLGIGWIILGSVTGSVGKRYDVAVKQIGIGILHLIVIGFFFIRDKNKKEYVKKYYCGKCGSELKEEHSHCPRCNAVLSKLGGFIMKEEEVKK